MDSSVESFKSAQGEDDKRFEEQRNEMEYSVDILESIKNNELDEQEYRRKTTMRLIIIAISSIVLILLITGAVYGIVVPMHAQDLDKSPPPAIANIKIVCTNTTSYQESCFSSISSSLELKQVFVLSLQVAMNELMMNISSLPESLIASKNYCNHNDSNSMPNAVLHCEFLVRHAIGNVNMSILSLQTGAPDMFSTTVVSSVRAWLRTALIDQETCLDGLMKSPGNCSGNVLEEMKSVIRKSTQVTYNSLEIISNIFTMIHHFKIPVKRKLLQPEQAIQVFLGPKLLRVLFMTDVEFIPQQ